MKVIKVGDWELAERLLNDAGPHLDRAMDVALTQEAEFLRGAVVRSFGRGPGGKFGKQSPLTKATGGGGKVLQRTGNLKNSIGVVEEDGGRFIGVPASAGGFKLAVIHEFGKTIIQVMTDKMRKFLHAKLKKVGPPPNRTGSRILVIHVPARPFISPIFKREEPKIPKRFQKRLAAALDGEYGTP